MHAGPTLQGLVDAATRHIYWHTFMQTPLPDEAVTVPPQTSIHITVSPLNSWEVWWSADILDERPEPLLIKNTNGSPLTVKQCMQAVYEYLLPLKEWMCQCHGVDTDWGESDVLGWVPTDFWYEMHMGMGSPGYADYDDDNEDGEDGEEEEKGPKADFQLLIMEEQEGDEEKHGKTL